MKEGKAMECYATQWYDKHKDEWINSWGWIKNMTHEQAKEYQAQDQAYFYKHIPLRIVKITTEVISETTGLQ